jgi:hypothetical protein
MATGGAVASGAVPVENRRAPRGDGKTQLIEREGERHPHRLVELLAFALMHDRDHKIVSFDLKLLALRDSAPHAPCARDPERAEEAAGAACGCPGAAISASAEPNTGKISRP